MMQLFSKMSVTMIVVAIVSGSCGGGSSQTAGIDRGGIVAGPIAGYGSIWVNGQRYSTATANITANGQPATETDLVIGQVVVLNSIESNGQLIATNIVYESNLRGPVASVDVAGKTFIALGQQIVIDSGTTFDSNIIPANLTGLMAADIVEVSGLTDSSGTIRATRVELEDAPYKIQLTGEVVSNTATELTIGAQLVDYSGATLSGFPAGEVTNGDLVRVSGSTFGSSGEIVATSVEFRGAMADVEEGESGDIEGLITDFVNSGSFSLSGFSVITKNGTSFSGGGAGDLANNVRIEAEGRFNAAGTLIAEEIEFREEGDALIEAAVDGIDAPTNSLNVFGIPVETTPVTTIEDKRDETRPFELSDIAIGDFLQISGTWNGSRFIATRLERVDPEDKFKLKGLAESAMSPDFSVAGKLVMTDSNITEFSSSVGSAQENFFAELDACLSTAQDCEVEVAWGASGALLIADEVSID